MTSETGSLAELTPGDSLAGYRIEDVLGEGGAGIVYLARREPDGGRVALKVLRPALARDPTLLRRFEHEARAAARLRHPNLVPLIEAGEADGRRFLISRYMAGGSLAARLARDGPLDVDVAVRLVAQVAAGLTALHAASIVHRDVKPGNILLESDGMAAVGDMGLARGGRDTVLTRPGQVLGTMDYMAPEIIRGRPATPASDVYALGCVAYEVVTGDPPFAGRSMFRAAFAHLDETPADPAAGRPHIAHALGAAIVLALAKSPEERPASATAYAEALVSVARERPPFVRLDGGDLDR